MQQILYADTPEIVLWYPNSFEAWRSDRWQGMLRWPEPDGAAFWGNPYSMLALEPATNAPAGGGTDSGMPAAVWVGGLVAVAAVVGSHDPGAASSQRALRRVTDGFHR